jgi:hypothetical protein
MMMPTFSLNNMIDASAGLTLLHFSISGLMCNRNLRCVQNQSESESSNNSQCVSKCSNSNSCSMKNFNMGISTAGLTGALLLYRGLRR